MRLVPRQTPVLIQGRVSYAASLTGIVQSLVPAAQCLSLGLRGRIVLETGEGWLAIAQLRPGMQVIYRPPLVTSSGTGLLVRTGDSQRTMSPGEAWGLGAGWLTPAGSSLLEVRQASERPVEGVMLSSCGTFIELGLRQLYLEGLQKMTVFQLKGFLRGCLFAMDSWAARWPKWSRGQRFELLEKLKGPLGRWIGHMGLITDPRGCHMPLALHASCVSRFSESGLGASGDNTIELPVTETCQVTVRVSKLVPECQVLGLVTAETVES